MINQSLGSGGLMGTIQTYPESRHGAAIFLFTIAILIAAIGLAQAHGGKHAGRFTHLQENQPSTNPNSLSGRSSGRIYTFSE
jgi:hypothetical protein